MAVNCGIATPHQHSLGTSKLKGKWRFRGGIKNTKWKFDLKGPRIPLHLGNVLKYLITSVIKCMEA